MHIVDAPEFKGKNEEGETDDDNCLRLIMDIRGKTDTSETVPVT